MKRFIGENDDMGCDESKLEHLGKKSHSLPTPFILFRDLSQFTNNTRRITDKEHTMYTYHK